MKQKESYIIAEKEERVEIFNYDGRLLKTFVIRENLPRALCLLREFNKMTDQQGNFLYNLFLHKEISLWTFHQEFIFWQYFRNFSKYEDVFRFFGEQNGKKIIQTKKASSNLRRILEIDPASKITPRFLFKPIIGGLTHFILKSAAWLISCLAIGKLIFKKGQKIIYSPDKCSVLGCDFRIYPLYKYLRENKKKYAEIFHTGLGKEFLGNFLKRKRIAIYLESLIWRRDKAKFATDGVDLSRLPRHLAVFFVFLFKEMSRRMSNSRQLISKLGKILSNISVKEIIALDDMRYTNELAVVCRENDIKIYGLQHGQFTKYHVGWMNYEIPQERAITFNKLFVWNDYWRNVLLKYSSQYNEQNVLVGGWLRRLPEIAWKRKKIIEGKEKSISLMLPFEIVLSSEEIRKYARKFLSLGIKIFFKIRPDLSRKKQFDFYGFSPADDVIVVDKIDGSILSQIDAVAGVYSTFLSEMIYYEKPLIQLDCSFDLGHYLKDDNLAAQLPKDFNLEILRDLIKNYRSRKNIVWPETKEINSLFAEILK